MKIRCISHKHSYAQGIRIQYVNLEYCNIVLETENLLNLFHICHLSCSRCPATGDSFSQLNFLAHPIECISIRRYNICVRTICRPILAFTRKLSPNHRRLESCSVPKVSAQSRQFSLTYVTGSFPGMSFLLVLFMSLVTTASAQSGDEFR